MRTTELYRDTRDSMIEADGDIPEDSLKEKSLMQRLLEAGYPLNEMFVHQRKNELYFYNTLLSTRVIDEWCKDNGFNKEQRCAPYKGTITGRQMYVCKLQDEKEAKRTMAADNNGKGKKRKDKKDNYER